MVEDKVDDEFFKKKIFIRISHVNSLLSFSLNGICPINDGYLGIGNTQKKERKERNKVRDLSIEAYTKTNNRRGHSRKEKK